LNAPPVDVVMFMTCSPWEQRQCVRRRAACPDHRRRCSVGCFDDAAWHKLFVACPL